jgi:hypothetical protein
VNVLNYDPKDFSPTNAYLTSCKAAFNISYTSSTKQNQFIAQCKPRPPRKFKTTDGEFQLFYAYMLGEIILLVSYYYYKQRQEAKLSESRTSRLNKQEADIENESLTSKRTALLFTGYKHTKFGNLVKFSLVLTSFVWTLILSVLCLDYYGFFGQYNESGNKMIFDNYDSLSWIFVISWNLAAIYFVTYRISLDSVETFCSLRTNLGNATLVVVQKEPEVPIHTANMGRIANMVISIEKRIKRWTGKNFDSEIVLVQKNNQLKYIDYQCSR